MPRADRRPCPGLILSRGTSLSFAGASSIATEGCGAPARLPQTGRRASDHQDGEAAVRHMNAQDRRSCSMDGLGVPPQTSCPGRRSRECGHPAAAWAEEPARSQRSLRRAPARGGPRSAPRPWKGGPEAPPGSFGQGPERQPSRSAQRQQQSESRRGLCPWRKPAEPRSEVHKVDEVGEGLPAPAAAEAGRAASVEAAAAGATVQRLPWRIAGQSAMMDALGDCREC